VRTNLYPAPAGSVVSAERNASAPEPHTRTYLRLLYAPNFGEFSFFALG
jgi:hypothetical protein